MTCFSEIMRKILVISVSAPPKTGAESIQTARYLKYLSRHFEICLITSKPEDRSWKRVDPTLSQYSRYIKNKVEIPIFSNTISRLSRYRLIPSRWSFPDSDFLFYFLGILQLKKLRSWEPDLIYSRSTPFSSAILAYKLKKKLNIPWVMHFSDPWADSPYRDNRYNDKDFKMEEKLISTADKITLTSENAVKLYKDRYPEHSVKFIYFPNVFDKNITTSQDISFNKKLRIVYSGNLYKKRGIKTLIQVLNYLRKFKPELLGEFEILLAGNIDDYNLRILKKSNLEIISHIGHLTYMESNALIQSGHILLTIDKIYENEVDHTFLPSKIMDYIAAKRLILGITHPNSPTYNIVHDHFGKCFYHDQIPQIGNFIIALIREYKCNNRSIFIPSGKNSFFSADYQSQKLKSTLDNIMK